MANTATRNTTAQQAADQLENQGIISCELSECLIADSEALDKITALLSGREWEVDDLDKIAQIITGAGREVLPCDDLDED